MSSTAARFSLLPLISVVALGAAICLWELAATLFGNPVLVPSFTQSAVALWDGFVAGTVPEHLLLTLMRVLGGFALGLLVGAPLGLLMGQFAPIRWMLGPYVAFFRFVTPVALLTLFIIWVGSGESSKIVLVTYISGLIILQNALRGVLEIDPIKVRAARMLGANASQIFWRVTVPASFGAVFVGARIAFGYAFMTTIAAEIIVNDSGIGYLIWTSQLYAKTALVFASLLLLGIIGIAFDALFSFLAQRSNIKFSTL